jgi:cytoskeletal protein CcmA (bactofilin family)
MLFSRKSNSHGELALQPARAFGPPPESWRPSVNASANDLPPHSYIGAALTIMGDLFSAGDVHVDGRVCGNISCGQVIVSKDAVITGAVIAEQAVIRGRITGTIRAPVVILQDTARVESEITYTVLAIDDGAMFEGAVHHSDHPLEERSEPQRDEAQASSPLVELERVMHAAGQASATQGSPADSHDAPCQTGGRRIENGTGAPAANGRAQGDDKRPGERD